MTTEFSEAAHPRGAAGRFTTKTRSEADGVALAPAEPFVQLATPAHSMADAQAVAAERGWTVAAPTWPRSGFGFESKRTDFTPTDSDAAGIRSLINAPDTADVTVYWDESQWREDDGDHYAAWLVVDVNGDDFILEEGPAAALTALFTEIDENTAG